MTEERGEAAMDFTSRRAHCSTAPVLVSGVSGME